MTPDFLPQLLAPNTLLAVLSPPAPSASNVKDGGDKDKEKEEKDRLAKQRIALRIVAELAMAGAWEEGAARGGDEVVRILKGFVSASNVGSLSDMQMTDDPQFTNLPLLTYFLKHLGRVYMGSMGEATSNDEAAEPMEELAPKAIQTSVRDLFLGYFNNASKTLVKGQIVSSLFPLALQLLIERNCSSRTNATMRHTSSREKSSKTANTLMSA